jgi:uncharacterized protein
MSGFPCTSCGACCKSIKGIPFLEEFDRGDGVCKHLDLETNRCLIYEERPLLCQIDRAYEAIFSTQLTLEEYYSLNRNACNELQKIHQVPDCFRVEVVAKGSSVKG